MSKNKRVIMLKRQTPLGIAYEVRPALRNHREAESVILSHPLGGNRRTWMKIVPMLQRSYNVVLYDLRGHGYSAPASEYSIDALADDVLTLVDCIGIKRGHFVGLSLGGMVSMLVAARSPDRVDKLILMCTSAHLGAGQPLRDRASYAREHGLEKIAQGLVRRWYSTEYVRQHPDDIAAVERSICQTSQEAYAGCCETVADLDLRSCLETIKAPTLVIAGEGDTATPPEHSELIASSIEDSTYWVVPGAAHLVVDEFDEQVAALVSNHLSL